MHLQRPPGDVGGHVRVAVAVAPDPRPEAQEESRLRVHIVAVAQRPPHILPQLGHHLPDRCGQVVQSLLDLVTHLRPLGPDFVGREQEHDLVVDLIEEPCLLLGGRLPASKTDQKRGDPLLLLQDRRPPCLGRMGREGRLDVEAAEIREDVLERNAGGVERLYRLGDRLRPRAPACALAVDADDLLLLRLVHQVEERGVGAQEHDDVVELEAGDPLRGSTP